MIQTTQLEGGMRRLTFRCDDAAGYELQILRARDGDFHLCIIPSKQDMDEDDRFALEGLYSNHLRVRMPMVGGGSHPELYDALLTLFEPRRSVAPAPPTAGPPGTERPI